MTQVWTRTSFARCEPEVADPVRVMNLDFEYELAGVDGSAVADQSQRWRSILQLLPQTEPLLVWGVTPRTAQLAPGPDYFPPVDLVREVNDKRFSHRLEKRLGIDLPHSCVVESLDQFRAAVENCIYPWVLKHPLGFSGRERVVGKAGLISDSAWGWARRKFSHGWTLVFEPWAEPRQDFSLHFTIERDGTSQFVGHCELVSDPGGVYRGNRVIASSLPDPEAMQWGHRVVRELAELGYWGPVGIDAFSGFLGELAVLRPLLEINARYSFGRLTLALRDWIPAGWSLLWWHPRPADRWQDPLEPLVPGASAGMYGLPLVADPEQGSGTVVVIAPTPDEIQSFAQKLSA